MLNNELIFYEPEDHNMIIKLTYPTDYIEKGAEEEDFVEENQERSEEDEPDEDKT